MTKEEQPQDPPPEPAKDGPDHAPNGVPHDADQGEAKGMPTSDRNDTEKAAQTS